MSMPAETAPSATEPPAIKLVLITGAEALSKDRVGHRAQESSDRDRASERAGTDTGDTPAA